MNKRYLVIYLVLLLLSIGAAGCYGVRPVGPQAKTSSVRILISGPDTRQIESTILNDDSIRLNNLKEELLLQAEVKLTNGTTMLSHTVTLQNGTAEVVFSDVVVGPWTIIVQLEDVDGNVAYEGSCRVAITADQITQASVLLKPALGTLELNVELTGIPSHERVAKLRLYKDSSNLRSQMNIKRDPGEDVISAVVSNLQPKTYDMMIKLFDDNGELVYESLWMSIQILPGRVTTADWAFSSGGVSIVVDCNEAPSTQHTSQLLFLKTESFLRGIAPWTPILWGTRFTSDNCLLTDSKLLLKLSIYRARNNALKISTPNRDARTVTL